MTVGKRVTRIKKVYLVGSVNLALACCEMRRWRAIAASFMANEKD